MATPPGDFVLVVPAEDRKTSDHWDFEGKAVCVPLVSSAGHGKADIKRLHYQEGRFALANTMSALFVKDESIIHPRYLFLFLAATCDELLVPLMCGATNVTMNSTRLGDILIPVPRRSLQDEVVATELLQTKAATLIETAASLRDLSSDDELVRFSDRLVRETNRMLRERANRLSISAFLPS
jgi:type I restriction enzyme M protein